MAENSNTGSTMNAISDGQNVLVGQIHAPSTPFESDMNPLYDFPFSGRETHVTVKDVEGIVSAIKESFSKFIEVQRSYLDSEKDRKSLSTENNDEASDDTKNDYSFSDLFEKSYELTEVAKSDIIQEIRQNSNESKSNLDKSSDELNKVDVQRINFEKNAITENLLDNENDENAIEKEKEPAFSQNEKLNYETFTDFITSSLFKFNENLSNLSENENKDVENFQIFEDKDTDVTNVRSVDDLTGIKYLEESEFSDNYDKSEIFENYIDYDNIVTPIKNYFDSEFDFNKDDEKNELNENRTGNISSNNFKDNQSNLQYRPFDEISNSFDDLFDVDFTNMEKQIVELIDGNFTKSISDMMLQDFSIESIVSSKMEESSLRIVEQLNASIENRTRENDSKNDMTSGKMMFSEIEKTELAESSDSLPYKTIESRQEHDFYKIEIEPPHDDNEEKSNEHGDTYSDMEDMNGGFSEFIESIYSNFVKTEKSEHEEVDDNVAEFPQNDDFDNEEFPQNPKFDFGFEQSEPKEKTTEESFIKETENAETEKRFSSDSLFDSISNNVVNMFESMSSRIGKMLTSNEDVSDFENQKNFDELDYVGESIVVSPSTRIQSEREYEEVNVVQTEQQPSEERGVIGKSDLSELIRAIERGIESSEERFDRIESMLMNIPKNGGNTKIVNTVFEERPVFEVERIR